MSGREELFTAARWRAVLRAAGYRAVPHFLDPAGGRLLRRLPDRANWTIALDTPAGRATLYLKCHEPCRRSVPPGLREWFHHERLREHGLAVPEPAAAGRDAAGRSFFASVALEGTVPLEEFLCQRAHRDRERIRRLAALVRRLHALEVGHRDLYLCHVLLRARDEALFLIDLQRLVGGSGRRLRRRWKVKDLAALHHSSAGLAAVTRHDRLRFLLGYLGKERIDRETRRWLGRVRRKARRMARHRPRHGDGGGGRPDSCRTRTFR
ncbi:MAG: hypothetical protein JXQ29_17885 [Planctomycetes bacterium]|nr:hypothetical protein [Planctomycetota bacterium]